MPDSSDGRPVNVLLVEDNAGDARLTEEAIKDSGIPAAFYHVHDGVEALAFIHRDGKFASAPQPDVILLDLNLPRKHGREVLEELRDDPEYNAIPVVVLTTSDKEQDIVSAFHLHANHYVTKPVEPDSFCDIVHRFVA